MEVNFGSFDQLVQRYQPICFLGEGEFGWVVKVFDNLRNKVMALKSYNYDDFHEIKISLKLNQIKNMTKSVIFLIDWAKLDFELEWNDNKFKKGEERINYIYTMTLADSTYSNIQYNLDNNLKLEILFELWVAVCLINKQEIVHTDLHFNNILIKKVEYARVYTIKRNKYLIHNKYLPIIADFGTAIIKEEKYWSKIKNQDFDRLRYAFKDIIGSDNPTFLKIFQPLVNTQLMFDKSPIYFNLD